MLPFSPRPFLFTLLFLQPPNLNYTLSPLSKRTSTSPSECLNPLKTPSLLETPSKYQIDQLLSNSANNSSQPHRLIPILDSQRPSTYYSTDPPRSLPLPSWLPSQKLSTSTAPDNNNNNNNNNPVHQQQAHLAPPLPSDPRQSCSNSSVQQTLPFTSNQPTQSTSIQGDLADFIQRFTDQRLRQQQIQKQRYTQQPLTHSQSSSGLQAQLPTPPVLQNYPSQQQQGNTSAHRRPSHIPTQTPSKLPTLSKQELDVFLALTALHREKNRQQQPTKPPQTASQRQNNPLRYQRPTHSHSTSCLMNTFEDNNPASFGFDLAEDSKPRVDFSNLSAMSGAEEPSFPGWSAHRSGADDVFTSPIFTDPSPALTDNNSFEVESCGPSPLVADDLEAPLGEFAHMPLFNDLTLFSPAQHVEHSFEQRQQHFGAPAEDFNSASSDFTLFPDVKKQSSSPPPRAQMAFNRGNDSVSEDPAVVLLRALQGAVAARGAQAPVTSASPTLISSPPKEVANSVGELFAEGQTDSRRPPLHHAATAPSLFTDDSQIPLADADGEDQECRRGTKRRLRVEDLLPLDAPIQSRNYLGPSATSRKDWVPPSSIDQGPTAEEMAAINAESDPLKAKRLSNTLAARRSRHRKAQERMEFQEKIAQLEAEAAQWKKRCERAEEDRDEIAQKLKKCKCT
ncbi:unnamed protein product [Sympodiomycopsis kandeliae]